MPVTNPYANPYGGGSGQWPQQGMGNMPAPNYTPTYTNPNPPPRIGSNQAPAPTTPPITNYPSMPQMPAQVPYAFTPAGQAAQAAQANQPPPPTPSETAWQKYLEADPFYQQTTGSLSAQGITDASERDRRIQQLLINLGEVPSGYTGPGVTDLIRGLAGENTAAGISTLARLQHAYDTAKRTEKQQLAARGILSSSETGYQLGELGLQNNQAQFDARNQALDALAQGNYAFTTSETQRALARSQAAFEAAQRASQRGVGPLWEGYGQDKGSFRLNPVGNANNYNQPYQPIGQTDFSPPGQTAQNLPPPPPGQMWAGPPGQEYLIPIPSLGIGA